jgi:hypothetical protein
MVLHAFHIKISVHENNTFIIHNTDLVLARAPTIALGARMALRLKLKVVFPGKTAFDSRVFQY